MFFDIGGSELLLIFIIVLVVAGPDRLPGIIRKVGRWIGYARRTTEQIKRDFSEELDVAELRKEFENASNLAELKELKNELSTLEQDLDKELRDAEKSFETLDKDNQAPAGPQKPNIENTEPTTQTTSDDQGSDGIKETTENKASS